MARDCRDAGSPESVGCRRCAGRVACDADGVGEASSPSGPRLAALVGAVFVLPVALAAAGALGARLWAPGGGQAPQLLMAAAGGGVGVVAAMMIVRLLGRGADGGSR